MFWKNKRPGSQDDLAATMSGTIVSTKNSAVNVSFGGKARITAKPRGDQTITIIAFGELVIFLGLVGLSAPTGSHCCS
jgi:hypothetical protein